MPDILFFATVTDADADQVGGKGLGLGKTAGAGLPVPPGFVVTTQAFRRLRDRGIRSDPRFLHTLKEAYHSLGGGPVAVRSSATAEDAADTSFAGQQETILGVEGDDRLVEAIERCWRSLFTDRAAAYRARQGVAAADLAMAVVVQQLVPAEAAGVLFTRDPMDPDGRTMLAEGSWGLGEAVVSGRVQPDRFRLQRTGAVLEKHLGLKSVRVTKSGEEHVPPAEQQQFCLSDTALSQLADLGRKVEDFYREPRDIEWAYAGGKFSLLQARPITAAGAAEREEVRQSVIRSLAGKADPKGTVWVRYNLSEVLPEPTPMTWSVVRRLLAADGGFGAMNRDLGAKPDPALGSQSAFDLVAGRPMANLSRLPRMQFARPPIEYPFAVYKADPRKALNLKPTLNPLAGSGCLVGLFKLPGLMLQLGREKRTRTALAENFDEKFNREIAPQFAAAAKAALARDWSKLDPAAVAREFETWVQKTLVDFARESLKPTVFADMWWESLYEALKPKLGEERARAAVGELALGAHPPPDADLGKAIRELSAGTISRSAFLERFGHRGTNEMELAQPRWSEAPEELSRLIGPDKAHGPPSVDLGSHWEKIADEAKIGGPLRDQFCKHVERLRTYLGLREAGKHYLLMGYAVIRRALVELDRRFGLNGGIFFLTPGDLTDLLAGKDMSGPIAASRKRRQTELSLEVPPVLFSDDLEAIGRPLPEPAGGDKLEGVPLSAGVAEGPALVLTEPAAAPPGEGGYILVCPTTDPAWVPLFVRAKGLVMETGGVLSHGAIVAREFGLPAVAGLPDVTRRVKTGQMVRVDGGKGTVIILGASAG
jgi:pyruvate,water dikinase